MSRPDVSIVGAGPAGASLAIRLARAGLKVALHDRARFPRDKVCGDFLGPRCLPLLSELGLRDAVLAAAGIRIEGMRLYSRHGREVVARYALVPGVEPGAGIERRVFDAMLVDAAREAGASVSLGRAVDPLDLPGALVVGADGRGSRVARAFGIGRAASRAGGYAVRAYLPAGPRLGPMGEIHLASWGYVGLGPVGHGRVNASIVVKDGRRRSLGDALRSMPALRGKVDAGDAEVLPDERTLAPLRHTPRAVVNGRALLVGDAAQLLDPITGEGVYHALRSSAMAASVIPSALEGGSVPPALARYARLHASEFRERLVVSRAVQALLPIGFPTEVAGVLLSRMPAFAARAVGYLGNVLP